MLDLSLDLNLRSRPCLIQLVGRKSLVAILSVYVVLWPRSGKFRMPVRLNSVLKVPEYRVLLKSRKKNVCFLGLTVFEGCFSG
jgi:hypothetical protein